MKALLKSSRARLALTVSCVLWTSCNAVVSLGSNSSAADSGSQPSDAGSSYTACRGVGTPHSLVVLATFPNGGVVSLHAVGPVVDAGAPPISLPPHWALQWINAQCTCAPTAEAISAAVATGEVTWHSDAEGRPASVTVHLTLEFPPNSWISSAAALDGTDIPVVAAEHCF
jgi:hypothetical protein